MSTYIFKFSAGYSPQFAYALAAYIDHATSHLPSPNIAFLCSPTAYVAYLDHKHRSTSILTDPAPDSISSSASEQSSSSSSSDSRSPSTPDPPHPSSADEIKQGSKIYLLEHDARFSLIPTSGTKGSSFFIQYDLHSPLCLPPSLHGQIDFIVVDPPFLNTRTNALVSQSVEILLRKERGGRGGGGGRLLLLTSNSVKGLKEVYAQEVWEEVEQGELCVEHEGGRLRNGFGAWRNWRV